ncbi:class I SAM-dependent methyltransferase [Halobacillus sp. A5]|uniref:class I SAM-dependent DNA methyltransferase n=1 Tax=Halobacillus sp. A5 TaxID=2880263 RepID=UPI0020A6D03C|nr:class I SAM-dependent methyltransferase [Halobacillus sp. A5]MCP3025613.1 class I SAM-dependent methyltransferase [Halobacillus sp. A5]
MSYQRMAEVYDRLMQDAPYNKWVTWTRHMIKKHRPRTKYVLDLGCGTGEITTRLAQTYQMTGVDLSEDMLAIASTKDDRRTIQWLRQDITRLTGLSNYDCIISYCDVINYIIKEEDLLLVFQHAYEALDSEGLFLFDVHSLPHINNDLIGRTFAEVYDDLSYIWFCDEGSVPGEFEHELTFFIRNGEVFERFDETHYQKGYSPLYLKEELIKAGFSILGVYADFSDVSADEGERLFFVCLKK